MSNGTLVLRRIFRYNTMPGFLICICPWISSVHAPWVQIGGAPSRRSLPLNRCGPDRSHNNYPAYLIPYLASESCDLIHRVLPMSVLCAIAIIHVNDAYGLCLVVLCKKELKRLRSRRKMRNSDFDNTAMVFYMGVFFIIWESNQSPKYSPLNSNLFKDKKMYFNK